MRKRATKQQIAASVCILAAATAALIWWWPHIYWAYQISRGHVQIPRVLVTDLKAPGRIEGWYDCRIGPVSLKLPPELAEKAERSNTKTSINFITPGQEVEIHIPCRIAPSIEAGQAQLAAELKLSPVHVIAESYRTGSDDFRWTMSRNELRKHQILVNLGGYFRGTGAPVRVETRFDEKLERGFDHRQPPDRRCFNGRRLWQPGLSLFPKRTRISTSTGFATSVRAWPATKAGSGRKPILKRK